MYRIVPSDTPKERKRRAKGERAKPKMEFSTRKGKRRWGKFSPSSPPPPRLRLLPILFLYSSSRLATPYFLGRKLFTSFRLVLSSSLYVRSSVRRPSVQRIVWRTTKVARPQRESGSIESEQKRARGEARGRGKGEGCLLGTKKCTDSTSSSPAEWTLEGECGEEIALTLGGGLRPRSTKNIY